MYTGRRTCSDGLPHALVVVARDRRLVVGVGGLIDPRALGVGYDTIGAELAGRLALGTLLVLLVVKLVIWSVALGSNTSGGILAPLLMLGAALGGLLGAVLPGAGEGTWALLGMAAAMAGVMRSPFTSIVFALELTHDVNSLLPLLVACTIAHLVSVPDAEALDPHREDRPPWLPRHPRIRDRPAARPARTRRDERPTSSPCSRRCAVAALYEQLPEGGHERRQRLYPVLDGERLLGVFAFSDVLAAHRSASPLRASDLARPPLLAFADETLREVADRMVSSGHGVLPVADRGDPQRLVGLVSQFDLLRAHERVLIEERHRERPLGPRRLATGLGMLFPTRESTR